MTSPNRTPPDLVIQPRDLSFAAKAETAQRWWLGGDPVATAFFNALSATFPNGERFFMDAVRRFRGYASPELKAQIAAFIAQEAMHTREHVGFNGHCAGQGYDLAAMEARAKSRLDFARTRDPLLQLAATVALEHFTAILANAVLSDPRHLDGAADEVKAMWRWHAIEEIEHKAVAFDTFLAATRMMAPLKRWSLRASAMLVATGLLFDTVGRNIADSFAADGLNRPRTWLRLLNYLLVRPGMLRQVLGPYFAYFRPGFHPWAHDDRALAREAELGLAVVYAGGGAA